MSKYDLLAIAEAMIASYNAQNADAYVAFVTPNACEAEYRGRVLREGADGIRHGLKAIFADYPENHVEIVSKKWVGNHVILEERVSRGLKTGGIESQQPFTVVAIYSFEADKCSRVEFVR